MATVCRRFAEQAIKVEQVLKDFGVTRKSGHVIFVLRMVNQSWGVLQQQVIKETDLPKHAVTRLIDDLVDAGLVDHAPDIEQPQQKTVVITDRGREMLSRVNASLRPSRSPVVEKPEFVALDLFDDDEELAASAPTTNENDS
jgi:DNA-binding MarR family transcriptional regulator